MAHTHSTQNSSRGRRHQIVMKILMEKNSVSMKYVLSLCMHAIIFRPKLCNPEIVDNTFMSPMFTRWARSSEKQCCFFCHFFTIKVRKIGSIYVCIQRERWWQLPQHTCLPFLKSIIASRMKRAGKSEQHLMPYFFILPFYCLM